MVSQSSPSGVVLNATENHPTCNIFTLSANINGIRSTGYVSSTAVDMNINVTPGIGRRGIHQYELRVSSFPLQFQWRGDQNWINNTIFKPTSVQARYQPPTVQTDQPHTFPASLKKLQGSPSGLQTITITWKHGKYRADCAHTVNLKVRT